MVVPAGIEPATRGFSVLCSTDWATEPLMAVWTGLEPATSAVTGRHSNQLNYQTLLVAGEGFEPTTFGLWARRATRLLHPAIWILKNGGGWGIRTPAGLSSPVGFQDRSLQPGLGKPPHQMVELSGIEPLTSCVQSRRSPSWAKAPFSMVGKTGFEPATPWSQTRCTTKLCYFPEYQIVKINWRARQESNPQPLDP